MKITVFGSGYVGLVTGTCFAEVGNEVICMDIDQHKIDLLNQGKVPIYEPGLDVMITRNVKAGRLHFTTDAKTAVEHGLFQFIAVGTPPDEDGSADLQYVLAVAETIASHMNSYRIVVNKSTVPVGTADEVKTRIADTLAHKCANYDFDVVSNPEFLKAGSSVNDFMSPDRIIIGTENPRVTELLKELYVPFNRNHDRFLSMDIRSAELTKYAANAMLATKISFMNELSNLAERLGADIEWVRHGIGSDKRIGYSFIYAGCGYGGSCFPKDINALVRSASKVGYKAELLKAVESVNVQQKQLLFQKINAHFNGGISEKTFALWGLAFKPNTDDMREAPSRVLIDSLLKAGARIRAYDPEAMNECRRIFGNREGLIYCENPDKTLEGANALVIVTEWKEFRSPNFERIRKSILEPVIFDGRNLYDPIHLKRDGFIYYGIGRGETVQ